jgi:hypothetical protein
MFHDPASMIGGAFLAAIDTPLRRRSEKRLAAMLTLDPHASLQVHRLVVALAGTVFSRVAAARNVLKGAAADFAPLGNLDSRGKSLATTRTKLRRGCSVSRHSKSATAVKAV